MSKAMDAAKNAFEAFWKEEMNTEVFDLYQENGIYMCHKTNRAWITWQAAQKSARADKLENPGVSNVRKSDKAMTQDELNEATK